MWILRVRQFFFNPGVWIGQFRSPEVLPQHQTYRSLIGLHLSSSYWLHTLPFLFRPFLQLLLPITPTIISVEILWHSQRIECVSLGSFQPSEYSHSMLNPITDWVWSCFENRTPTFRSPRKVDIYRFFVKILFKCLLKSVSRPPLFAAGVVADALVSFVFQSLSWAEISSNGPCATQISTFGRRHKTQRPGGSLVTPLSQFIRHARPCTTAILYGGDPRLLPDRAPALYNNSTFSLLPSIEIQYKAGLGFRLPCSRVTLPIKQSSGSILPWIRDPA